MYTSLPRSRETFANAEATPKPDYRSRVLSKTHARLGALVAATQTRDAQAIDRSPLPFALRIRLYAQETDAGLIVLAAESRQTAHGSVSTHVVTEAQRDILARMPAFVIRRLDGCEFARARVFTLGAT